MLGPRGADTTGQWLDIPDRATGDHKLAAWQREHDLSNETMLRELLRRDQADRS